MMARGNVFTFHMISRWSGAEPRQSVINIFSSACLPLGGCWPEELRGNQNNNNYNDKITEDEAHVREELFGRGEGREARRERDGEKANDDDDDDACL